MQLARARQLRTGSTAPERRLWQLLRSLKPLGFHFRQQVPVGSYIADFACHHARLIIEVDGDTHGTAAASAYDAERSAFLRAAGYDVLRFGNRDVIDNLDGVSVALEQALEGRATLPTPTRLPPPSPQGGGVPGLTAPSSPSPLRGGTARSAKGGCRAGNSKGTGQRTFRKGRL